MNVAALLPCHVCRPVVTVTIDSVSFLQPVMLGRLLLVHGSISWVGTTSIEVTLQVEAENLLTGERLHTNSVWFVYVALGDDRRPTPVLLLLLETKWRVLPLPPGRSAAVCVWRGRARASPDIALSHSSVRRHASAAKLWHCRTLHVCC